MHYFSKLSSWFPMLRFSQNLRNFKKKKIGILKARLHQWNQRWMGWKQNWQWQIIQKHWIIYLVQFLVKETCGNWHCSTASSPSHMQITLFHLVHSSCRLIFILLSQEITFSLIILCNNNVLTKRVEAWSLIQ
jgi:hypothetical protein